MLGNAGTLISFRIGPEDAFMLAQAFQPKFDEADLINLPNHNIYLKLMIEGVPSQPFSVALTGAKAWCRTPNINNKS